MTPGAPCVSPCVPAGLTRAPARPIRVSSGQHHLVTSHRAPFEGGRSWWRWWLAVSVMAHHVGAVQSLHQPSLLDDSESRYGPASTGRGAFPCGGAWRDAAGCVVAAGASECRDELGSSQVPGVLDGSGAVGGGVRAAVTSGSASNSCGSSTAGSPRDSHNAARTRGSSTPRAASSANPPACADLDNRSPSGACTRPQWA